MPFHRAPDLCFGTATGFSLAGLLEALRSPSTLGWLTFLGSVVSTAAGIWIAERKRSDRGRADQAAAELQLRTVRLLERLELFERAADHP